MNMKALVLQPEYEWFRLLPVVPFLLFPVVSPIATMAVLALYAAAWAAQAMAGTWRWFSSSFTWPVLMIAALAAITTWTSPVPDVSLPKFAGIVLGVLAFRAVGLAITTHRQLWTAVLIYLCLSTVMVTTGLTGVAPWVGNQSVAIGKVRTRIPQLIRELPGTEYANGVNPNALGGTTLFALPLILALWLARRDRQNGGGEASQIRPRLLVLFGLLQGAVWLLSDGRTAWLAFALSAVWLVCMRLRPRLRLVAFITIVAAGLNVAIMGWDALRAGLAGRMEVWERAVDGIAAAPWTGFGLNMFRRIIQLNPPVFQSTETNTAHAHNTFLQVALDVGLPGLIVYLWILWLAGRITGRVARTAAPGERALVLGLAASLVAVHVFGMADAIALGAKVGLLQWCVIGLLASIDRLARETERKD